MMKSFRLFASICVFLLSAAMLTCCTVPNENRPVVSEKEDSTEASKEIEETPLPDTETELPLYNLIRRDGQWYMSFTGATIEETDLSALMRAPDPVEFYSIDELITFIKEGRFTEDQLKSLRYYAENKDGNEIKIFDLDHPARPVYPSSFSFVRGLWYGEYYNIEIVDGDGNGTSLAWLTDELYDFTYKRWIEQAGTGVKYRTEPVTEGIKTTYTEQTGVSEIRVEDYTPGDAITIRKAFLLSYYGGVKTDLLPTISEDIPYSIRVFNGGDIKFRFFLSNATRDFSVEELLEFGFVR